MIHAFKTSFFKSSVKIVFGSLIAIYHMQWIYFHSNPTGEMFVNV